MDAKLKITILYSLKIYWTYFVRYCVYNQKMSSQLYITFVTPCRPIVVINYNLTRFLQQKKTLSIKLRKHNIVCNLVR